MNKEQVVTFGLFFLTGFLSNCPIGVFCKESINNGAVIGSVMRTNCHDCLSEALEKFKKPKDAITYCTKQKNECDRTLWAAVKEVSAGEKRSQLELLQTLSDTSRIVEEIEIDASHLDEQGNLTETILPELLASAYSQKILDSPEFSRKFAISAKNILKKDGGYNTLQLFSVHVKDEFQNYESDFIVKESRQSFQEVLNLESVKSFLSADSLKIIDLEGYPTIALPLHYFSYTDAKRKRHVITVMSSAPGIKFCDLIAEFRDHQSKRNKELIKRGFTVLGQELARFHRKFMRADSRRLLTKTVVHGDFSADNMIFDEERNHFTFIDNETMRASLKKLKRSALDLLTLFWIYFSTNEELSYFRHLLKGIRLSLWFELALGNFVRGYCSVYHGGEKARILGELNEIFGKSFAIPGMDFDASTIRGVQKKYIVPLFNKIMKEFKS